MSGKRINMFWRLIFRALRLRLSRVFIVFSALMVGASIVSAMTAVYFDIHSKMSQELRTFGANFYIGSKNGELIKISQLTSILQNAPDNLIRAASPYLYGVARADLEKIVVMGLWFSELNQLAPYWQIQGLSIGVNFDSRHAMIGKSLAQRLNLQVGDSITLNLNAQEKHSFKIKSIIEAGDATDNMLIVNLDFAQHWFNKPGLANNALLNLNNEHNQASEFAQQLSQRYPELDIHPILKVSAAEGQILGKIQGLMGLISAVILLLATLCVNTTLIAMIGERRKEFALQKALGAKPRDIVIQIITEMLIITFLAIICGLGLGYLLAQIVGLTVFKSSIDMRLPVLPITFALSFFVAFLAVIMPTRRALQIQTANVLKGE